MKKKTNKEKLESVVLTPEQSAIMSLSRKYNATHGDVRALLQSIPQTHNLMLAIARMSGITPQQLSVAIGEHELNKSYEEDTATLIKNK